MGFFCAVICLMGWGLADLFYKKSSDEEDKLSHLKIAVWVGLVMGVCAIILMLISDGCHTYTFKTIAANGIIYFPASLSYIISMVIGYAGLRYLEVSIISPVQNSSGGLAAAAMILWFVLTGKYINIADEYGIVEIIGIILCVAGVVMLAVAQKKLEKNGQMHSKACDSPKNTTVDSGSIYTQKADSGIIPLQNAGSYSESTHGAISHSTPVHDTFSHSKLSHSTFSPGTISHSAKALIFPILYCIFDTVGTAADGIILDVETGLGLSEIDVLILYGLTFFVMAIAAWVYMLIKNKELYNPFESVEIKNKGVAALFEEFGQIFYVYAMADNPVTAAPIVASYCIVSVVLSHVFLKERLEKSQYACVICTIAGIVILGVAEGAA